VNCDGAVNITDAVSILQYLFQGGPAPCAIAQDATCCEQISAKLDDLRKSIDSLRGPCSTSPNRFTDNGDGTISDSCLGIMWQSAPLNIDVDGDGNPDPSMNWSQAKAAAVASNVGGHTDWRLPTFDELETLIRFVKEKPYTVSVIPPFELPFSSTTPYWTSTQLADKTVFAAEVTPTQASISNFGTGFKAGVWLVRTGI
jgi:hypothetical protein